MAFEGLSGKLSAVFKKMRNKGKLKESDIKEAMREVRLALLEADVNYKVAKDFVAAVTEKAVGDEVLESLTPAQMVVKIVNDELTNLMGETGARLNFSSRPPTIVMMCGLQGSGKTTHSAKLALHFREQGKRPLLVACDVYRPAAIEQLKVVGEKAGVPVFDMGQGDPVEIARRAVMHAKDHGNDLVILDTAGRLHIDEALMDELKRIRDEVSPQEILLVVDAMVGQDAVNVASAFDEALGISGVILTKLDGDTRGGAALSVRAVTGKPVKFVGTGEKLGDLEPFYPDRMASRILGMGDVLTLISGTAPLPRKSGKTGCRTHVRTQGAFRKVAHGAGERTVQARLRAARQHRGHARRDQVRHGAFPSFHPFPARARTPAGHLRHAFDLGFIGQETGDPSPPHPERASSASA